MMAADLPALPKLLSELLSAGDAGLSTGASVAAPMQSAEFKVGTSRWWPAGLELGRSLQRLNGIVEFVQPKSERSRRTVPVPAFASAELAQHRKDQDHERVVAGGRGRGADDLVFCTVQGLPLHRSTITHQFHHILQRAETERRSFHDLRHSTATVLTGEGVPARVVMELLGHSQISLTNTYSHVLPEMQRQAAGRMESFLRGLDPG